MDSSDGSFFLVYVLVPCFSVHCDYTLKNLYLLNV